MRKLILFTTSCFLTFNTFGQVFPDNTPKDFDIFNGNVKSIEEAKYILNTAGTLYDINDNYEFNNDNKLIKYNNGFGGGIYGIINKSYTYDTKGRLTESKEYDDLFGDLKKSYYYDDKGNLTHVKELSTDDVWGYSCDLYYTTDKKGNVLTEKKSFSGTPGTSIVFTWKKGLLIKQETFKSDNSFEQSDEYEYNKDGKKIKKTRTTANGITQVATYQYNASGLEISSTSFYNTIKKTEYLNFDSKGNWIRKKITYYDISGALTSKYYVYRSISYYDGTSYNADSYIITDNKKDLSGINLNKTTWTHKENNNFTIAIPGYRGLEKFAGAYLSTNSNHVICYEEVTNATFLIKDFRGKDSGYTNNAIYMGNTDIVYWMRIDSSYWVYHNGARVSNTKNFWLGDDLVVYVTDLKRTFKLPNYYKAEPGVIHKSIEISTTENTYFKKSNKSYWLYIEGTNFDFRNAYKTVYVQNDLLLYSIDDKKTYLLKNYKNTADNVLGQVELISTSAEAFVYKSTSTGNYFLITGGIYDDRKKSSKYAPNNRDIIITITDTGEQYIVTDFKGAAIFKLLEAKKVK